MRRLLVLPALVLLLAACGGDGGDVDRVLQFTGRDETESNVRERTRQIRDDQPALWVQLCGALEGKSPSQAAAILVDDDPDPTEEVPGATMKPGQKADPDDLIRAAEIVQEECEG